VRQLADEADGVGQHGRAATQVFQLAHGGIERGEQLIGRVDVAGGQRIEEVDLPALV
jgi:hypothetical protein